MQIRSAKKTDLESIRKLWYDCFQDPYEYIDFFLSKRFSPEFCAVLEEAGEIIGMIHLLPCTIAPDQKAFYWYASGIRSDRRKEGLFRKLAEFVKVQTNKAGFRNICVPVPGLENFYRSIGFSHAYTASDKEFLYNEKNIETETEKILICEASADDFIQEKKIMGDCTWDRSAIQYAIDENTYCDGKTLKIVVDKNVYMCFAIEKENGFLIDYHNIRTDVFSKIKNTLFRELNCEKIIFRTEGNQKIVGLSDSDLIDSASKISMTLA